MFSSLDDWSTNLSTNRSIGFVELVVDQSSRIPSSESEHMVCVQQAGMSSLLVVSFCYWDSGWYGVTYFRCRPQVCLLSPQHDDTHGT